MTSHIQLARKRGREKTLSLRGGSSGWSEENLEPAGTAGDHLAAVPPAPPLAETQPQRVRVIRSVQGVATRHNHRHGKIKDDHRVAGEYFVHVELFGGKVLQGGGVDEDGDVAAVVEA
jgi:hypothetical protein